MNWILIQNSATAVFAFMCVMFIIAQRLKDNSIVDIGWGIGFVLITVLLLATTQPTAVQWVGALMVFIWGFRLAAYIFNRNKGKAEDFRYAQWRKDWGKYVVPRAFLQVFMLQGIIMLIIAAPLFVLFSQPLSMSWNVLLGILVWTVGFYFEAVGDHQMQQFKADSANQGKIMRSGLWKYTRHPNYFGEATLWWGIFLTTLGSPVWYFAAIGPAVLTFLLLKVSGVTMLERKYKGNDKYADYIRTTNAFLPWFPKEATR